MPGRDRMPCAWSRRQVLQTAGLGSAAWVLTACGIRLEDDAPRIPLLPTREPIRDELALLGALARARARRDHAAAERAAAATPPAARAVLTAALAGASRQVDVLEQLLRERGAPVPTRPPSPEPTATTSTRTATDTGTLRLGPTAQQLTELAAASSANVALLGSLLAEQAATATVLGTRVIWPAGIGPAGEPAARLLDAARATAYGLEVAAAQADSGTRALAMSTLANIRARARVWQSAAGATAGAPSLGYELPFAVSTPAAARRLALHVLAGLTRSYAAGLGAAAGTQGPLTALVRGTAEVQLLAVRWGSTVPAFPGLVT